MELLAPAGVAGWAVNPQVVLLFPLPPPRHPVFQTELLLKSFNVASGATTCNSSVAREIRADVHTRPSVWTSLASPPGVQTWMLAAPVYPHACLPCTALAGDTGSQLSLPHPATDGQRSSF